MPAGNALRVPAICNAPTIRGAAVRACPLGKRSLFIVQRVKIDQIVLERKLYIDCMYREYTAS
jgi:hypothetical protein